MAIEYVGGKDVSRSGSTSAGMSVALTSGLGGGIGTTVAVGDLVVASFATGSDRDRGPFSISDGTTAYELAGSELNASDTYDANLRVAYKFMADPVDSTVEFGPSGNNNDAAACTVQVFRGVDQTTPLDVAAVTATGTNTAKPNPGAITPVTSGAFVVAVGSAGHSSGPFGFTSSDLSDFRTDSFDDVFDVAIGAGYYAWTSGAFNPAAFGFDGLDSGQYSWTAVTLALRPAAVSSYELAADAGSYEITGQTAAFTRTREIAGESAAYSVIGQAASVAREYVLAAAAGAYAVSGTAAALERGFETVAGAGSYLVTGADASLTITGERAVIAGDGTYVISGQTASLLHARNMSAESGAYGLIGQAGFFTRTLNKDIVANTGVYSSVGADASLDFNTVIVNELGAMVASASIVYISASAVSEILSASVSVAALVVDIELTQAEVAVS